MLDKILELVRKKRNIFVTGGAGVGKSYTLDKLSEKYPDIVITATSGVSAVNVQGETIHKWSGAWTFNFPEALQASKIKKYTGVYNCIKSAKTVAIDEISMLAGYQLDYLNKLFKILRGNEKPFGGIQLLLFGDLFQLPPVKLHEKVHVGTDTKKVEYCFKAKCWKELDLEIIKLEKVYRQKDVEFANVLNKIREGKTDDLDILLERNNIEPPIDATRLFTVNSKVDTWNKTQYEKIDEEEKIYWSYDIFHKGQKTVNAWTEEDKLTDNQKEARNSFDEKCKAVRCLKLKVGTRVMLLQNIDTSAGLCNGACGYVTELKEKSVTVKFDNDVVKDLKKCNFHLNSGGKILIERKQIPLMLAYACTTHKAQGLSIDKLSIDFSQTFAPGQSYVALSRATNLDTLYLKNFSADKIFVDPEIVKFYKNLK